MDNYYDIINNRIHIRSDSINNQVECVKVLQYPNVLKSLYTISENGKVYSIMNDDYISWGYRGGLPYVNLCCYHESNIGIVASIEPFFIKDLMAYNYIANADNYLERGCKVMYKDGDPRNNNYTNIMYV